MNEWGKNLLESNGRYARINSQDDCLIGLVKSTVRKLFKQKITVFKITQKTSGRPNCNNNANL